MNGNQNRYVASCDGDATTGTANFITFSQNVRIHQVTVSLEADDIGEVTFDGVDVRSQAAGSDVAKLVVGDTSQGGGSVTIPLGINCRGVLCETVANKGNFSFVYSFI